MEGSEKSVLSPEYIVLCQLLVLLSLVLYEHFPPVKPHDFCSHIGVLVEPCPKAGRGKKCYSFVGESQDNH